MNTLLVLCRGLFYINRNYTSKKYGTERLKGALAGDLVNTLAFDPHYSEAAKTNGNLLPFYCIKEKILIKSLLGSILLLEILICL